MARNKGFQGLVEKKIETGRDVGDFQNLKGMINYLGRRGRLSCLDKSQCLGKLLETWKRETLGSREASRGD